MIFINHSHSDKELAKKIYDALINAGYKDVDVYQSSNQKAGNPGGAEWEKYLWRRLNRSVGVIALITKNSLESPWCISEILLARERGLHIIPILDKVPRPSFLSDIEPILFDDLKFEEVVNMLFKALKDKHIDEAFPLPSNKGPYPGMDAFQEDEAAIFFGRRNNITDIITKLNQCSQGNEATNKFILILGASGSGKSSLVRAGILPRLKPRQHNMGRNWIVLKPIVPSKGFRDLVTVIYEEITEIQSSPSFAEIYSRIDPQKRAGSNIRTAANALSDIASELLASKKMSEKYVLFFIDQLEEVFETKESDSDAQMLLKLLLFASKMRDSRIIVIATMRSDFLNEFQQIDGVTDSYTSCTLDPMDKNRYGEIIEGPAYRYGLKIEPGLVERLKEDTGTSDALPLLAVTLKKLYEKCAETDNKLKISDYESLFPKVEYTDEFGKKRTATGVQAAVQQEAEKVLKDCGFDTFSDQNISDLRETFLKLTKINEDGQFTRRRIEYDLISESCLEVINSLRDKRLLTTDIDLDSKKKVISVTHEALFRVWKRLHDWLTDAKKALLLRSTMEAAANEWFEQGKPDKLLWSAERIVDTINEINDAGIDYDNVDKKALVYEFLGPISFKVLVALIAFDEDKQALKDDKLYGESWRPPLNHEERAQVGDRLALINDDRSGVGLNSEGLPDIEWCKFPGGEIELKIMKVAGDNTSGVKNTLTKRILPFEISRFPITVNQFKEFVSDCFGDGKWVSPLKLPFDLDQNNPLPKHAANRGNQAAYGISYLHALAFCHWVGHKFNSKIQIPSEFEWQAAANGGDIKRKYPWGSRWSSRKANTFENDLGRQVSVGLYPMGRSPIGCEDLAGNIWEWCRNSFDQPESEEHPYDPKTLRTLRGGSWDYLRVATECDFRLRPRPNLRYHNVGFRIVRYGVC